MGAFSYCWMLLALQLLLLQLWLTNASLNLNNSQTYIIHLNNSHKPSPFPNHESWHRNMVKSLTLVCPKDKDAFLVYSYTHATHRFSAKLTPCQLAEVEKWPAHLTTHKESFGLMFTTHTPKFLGLNRSLGIWPTASYGKDVIIGVVDTGIWPESESFNDDGMSSIPSGWKGRCENGTAFTSSLCNNKLIGARSFSKGLNAAGLNGSSDNDFDSPRDSNSHGTHTSSTAAGVAIGIAPRAHLASYKVIWNALNVPASSVATDILAGMDQAISDGVDVMSISLGIREQPSLYQDVIAIASFSAIVKGIVVVCAAGNSGPDAATMYNAAPWIMTVGAGTIDRNFVATLELGNGLKFKANRMPNFYPVTNRTPPTKDTKMNYPNMNQGFHPRI
ncbi:Peptidase S8/S53 domain-containing protein [Artemisia annua]|uniref:Peptidase S8/S53 domain-containing protein n=1 Tax=Artemisia annua TaxID=35608 RepID=A0A2U1MCG8_ARTAN|nr:Peptidase S8/S53 domain-containing protein [Artemisia annua]